MSDTWLRDPDVLVTELDRELVLLHPRTRAMFTLNETGQVVWGAIDRGADAAVDAVVEAFDVDRSVAHADVAELIGALADAGLLVRS
jgi:ribosomal protein L18